jgi:3D (Asp-Asp-Asp) domain-containing protein
MSVSEPPGGAKTIATPLAIHFRGSRTGLAILIALLCGLLPSCISGGAARANEHVLHVESTAYNSVRNQTNAQPNITAWGDVLEPGMKSVAISRDLMTFGLTHGTTLTIDGLPGEYRVLDKMAKRWTKKIDIYMGEDVQAARDWGIRKVTIRWRPVRPSD